jgi:hypothetical protein
MLIKNCLQNPIPTKINLFNPFNPRLIFPNSLIQHLLLYILYAVRSTLSETLPAVRSTLFLLSPKLPQIILSVKSISYPIKILFLASLLKGHIHGLVVDGESLWRKFTFRAELAENTRLAKKPLCLLCSLWL